MGERWKVELEFDSEKVKDVARARGQPVPTWEEFEPGVVAAFAPVLGSFPEGTVVVRTWKEG